MSIDKIDIPAEMEKAIQEILETDPRQDQFRAVKAILLYQAAMLENIRDGINALGSVMIGIEEALKQPFYGTGAKEPKK